MKKTLLKTIDKLLENPTKLNVSILDNILKVGIPFNAPHGFRIKSLSKEGVEIYLPNRKLNHNHLGGVHACAMATVGEFCAGMTILTHFGISKYRLILSELNVKYTYQGRTDLMGFCSGNNIDSDAVADGLTKDGKYLQTLTTVIKDKNENLVATIETTWQIKSWDKVTLNS